MTDEDEEPPPHSNTPTPHIHTHSHMPIRATPQAQGTPLTGVEACTLQHLNIRVKHPPTTTMGCPEQNTSGPQPPLLSARW